MVQLLLQAGASVNPAKCTDNDVLCHAVTAGCDTPQCAGVVQLLLSAGAAADAVDRDGSTALQLAAKRECLKPQSEETGRTRNLRSPILYDNNNYHVSRSQGQQSSSRAFSTADRNLGQASHDTSSTGCGTPQLGLLDLLLENVRALPAPSAVQLLVGAVSTASAFASEWDGGSWSCSTWGDFVGMVDGTRQKGVVVKLLKAAVAVDTTATQAGIQALLQQQLQAGAGGRVLVSALLDAWLDADAAEADRSSRVLCSKRLWS